METAPERDRGEAGGSESAVEPLLALIDELDQSARRNALTHSSWTDRRASAWGRLAFLGDSVLGLVVAEELFTRFSRSDIGRLTKIHGQAVSGRACAEIALELGVPAMLEEVHPDESPNGISIEELLASERAMASIVESLIGACYLHFGLERTGAAILSVFRSQIELASGTLLDFKSALQERLARHGQRVSYRVVEESGPPHARQFQVEALVEGERVGLGGGSSKKAAEQAAAAQALADDSPA